MPVLSQPRAGCRGLTSNGQSWGGAGCDFGWAWGITGMASVPYGPVRTLCHGPAAAPRSLAPRESAALPHKCRRLAASSAKVAFSKALGRALQRFAGQVHEGVAGYARASPDCGGFQPGRLDGTRLQIRYCPVPLLLLP